MLQFVIGLLSFTLISSTKTEHHPRLLVLTLKMDSMDLVGFKFWKACISPYSWPQYFMSSNVTSLTSLLLFHMRWIVCWDLTLIGQLSNIASYIFFSGFSLTPVIVYMEELLLLVVIPSIHLWLQCILILVVSISIAFIFTSFFILMMSNLIINQRLKILTIGLLS